MLLDKLLERLVRMKEIPAVRNTLARIVHSVGHNVEVLMVGSVAVAHHDILGVIQPHFFQIAFGNGPHQVIAHARFIVRIEAERGVPNRKIQSGIKVPSEFKVRNHLSDTAGINTLRRQNFCLLVAGLVTPAGEKVAHRTAKIFSYRRLFVHLAGGLNYLLNDLMTARICSAVAVRTAA